MGLRITTWNVNGIRNPFSYQPWRNKRTFDAMFDILEADVVVMQELKIQRKDLRDDMVLVPGWDCFFSLPKKKKGYSGVAIYTRQAKCHPLRAEEGVLGVLCPPGSNTRFCDLPETQCIGGYLSEPQLKDVGVDPEALDAEGRCVALEFPAFIIFGIYSPANSSGLRDDFRYGFLHALDKRVRNLVAMGKNVIVTGDLNVSRDLIDTAKAEENMRKDGLTFEDYISTPNRRIFNQLLEGGVVFGNRDHGRESPVLWDVCRAFHPQRTGMYTHWEQKINARPGNFGSRIDFVLCSLGMKSWFLESNIQEGLMGSDHCPVYAVLADEVEYEGKRTYLVDIMNPRGFFETGVENRAVSANKVSPALSGKLLAEFDKRRNIKDMFGKGISKAVSKQDVAAAGPTSSSAVLSNPLIDNVPSRPLQQLPVVTPTSACRSHSSRLPSQKRVNSEASSHNIHRPLKRSKATFNATPLASPKKGQQSLREFFEQKPHDVVPFDAEESSTPNMQLEGSGIPASELRIGNASGSRRCGKPHTQNMTPHYEGPDKTSLTPTLSMGNNEFDEVFVDPIVSKESWGKLFSKPVGPRCDGHNEPCKLMKTKKPGFNCGREFWMCARPLGPSGAKEKNTQWRCPTFIWNSDWKS